MLSIVFTGNFQNPTQITLVGRDKNRQRTIEKINNFEPYFYVLEDETAIRTKIKREESGHISLFGEKLKKLVVPSPSYVKDARELFQKHYEADIKFVDRYLIDKVENLGDDPIRHASIDIEVESSKEFPKPEEAKYPVISIVSYDSFLNKYFVFVWREDLEEKREEKSFNVEMKDEIIQEYFKEKQADCVIYYFNTEEKMLRTFLAYIKATDPDLMLGWNFIKFDMLYIYNRLLNIGLDPRHLSNFGNVYVNPEHETAEVAGRGVFDLLDLYRKFYYLSSVWNIFALQSYSLANIADLELGAKKIKLEKNPGLVWRENIDELVEYNVVDAVLTEVICRKVKIIDMLNEIRKLCVVRWEMITKESQLLDIYILRYCKRNGNIVLPSKHKRYSESFEGALVFDPPPGVHANVVDMDLKSMYPSIIRTFNMSPETKVKKGSEVTFSYDKIGLIPIILDQLYAKRNAVRTEMNELPIRSGPWFEMNRRQNVLKLLLNSLYGVMGYARFRLSDVDIAAKVTYFGREMLKWCKAQAELTGRNVVYGDTDSLYIKFDSSLDIDALISQAVVLQNAINKSFDVFAEQNGAKKHYFEIELDRIYESILFVDAKKKYAGIVAYVGGKKQRTMHLAGLEVKRRDTPQYAQKILYDLYWMILERQPKIKITDKIKEAIKDARNQPINDISMSIRIGKNLNEYVANAQHVRGLRYAEKSFNLTFQRMDYVKIFFVKSTGKYPKTDIVCLPSDFDLPADFEIDYDRTVNRIFAMKLQQIFRCLNWNWDEIEGQKSFEHFFPEFIKTEAAA